jgi:RNA polymerase sigma-70 factor (ECF subfamily)
VPENAAAWLFRVAHNIAIDSVRRNQVLGEKTAALIRELSRSAADMPGDPGIEEQLRDDELRMIFMCCHPEISRDSRVALSLKTVGGFSAREIARAFLADDAAIAQRLVRAKREIRDRRLTLDMPRGGDLKLRLDSVLDVVERLMYGMKLYFIEKSLSSHFNVSPIKRSRPSPPCPRRRSSENLGRCIDRSTARG